MRSTTVAPRRWTAPDALCFWNSTRWSQRRLCKSAQTLWGTLRGQSRRQSWLATASLRPSGLADPRRLGTNAAYPRTLPRLPGNSRRPIRSAFHNGCNTNTHRLWHAQIPDPTVTDAALDRLVHNAHRVILPGETMRKFRAKQTDLSEMK